MQKARRYLENWQEEVDSAAQYRALAQAEPQEKLARVYANLARMEENHIAFWEGLLRKTGAAVPPRKPSWRARLLIFITRRFGPRPVLATIAASELVDRDHYRLQPETAETKMAAQERWHSRVLQQVLQRQPGGIEGGFLGRLEGRHRAVGGNALRAAVLGANDGLCSNLSLVMGVAGASVSSRALLLTGLAGLLAGAFSMALGEFISVTSARELARREIRIESDELSADPKGEAEELMLIYQSKGLSEAEARSMVEHLLSDPAKALDTLSREELGIDPGELGGSPWEAAITSLLLFAIGALIPVIPFFFMSGAPAILVSLGLSALALLGIGALITVFTGRSAWLSGGRQLALGLFAAGVTFVVGRLIGVAVS